MAERSLKLEIRDMTKRYDNGDGVEHINLKIYEGEIVTMLGPSGCGKSTILRTIGGFLDVTDGDILIDNESIGRPPCRLSSSSFALFPPVYISTPTCAKKSGRNNVCLTGRSS